jgi:hypothetical protein
VAQGVDVAVGVAVHVHRQPVHGEGQPGGVGPVPGRAGHLVDGGVGVVGRGAAGDRGLERDRPAEPDLGGGCLHPVRRQVVQRAAPVAGPPRRRAAQPLVEGGELVGVQGGRLLLLASRSGHGRCCLLPGLVMDRILPSPAWNDGSNAR